MHPLGPIDKKFILDVYNVLFKYKISFINKHEHITTIIDNSFKMILAEWIEHWLTAKHAELFNFPEDIIAIFEDDEYEITIEPYESK